MFHVGLRFSMMAESLIQMHSEMSAVLLHNRKNPIHSLSNETLITNYRTRMMRHVKSLEKNTQDVIKLALDHNNQTWIDYVVNNITLELNYNPGKKNVSLKEGMTQLHAVVLNSQAVGLADFNLLVNSSDVSFLYNNLMNGPLRFCLSKITDFQRRIEDLRITVRAISTDQEDILGMILSPTIFIFGFFVMIY